MENKRILLPTKRYFKAEEQDINLRINLEKEEILLREGDMDISLNLGDLFEKERNQCNNYKIYGKIKMIFRNMYSGNTEYLYLKNRLYLLTNGAIKGDWSGYLPYDEFVFLRRDLLREQNLPGSGSTLGTFTPNINLTSGDIGHTIVTPITAPYQNWNLYMTYVYSADTQFSMGYSLSGGTDFNFVSGDGIPFRVYDNGNSYTFISPVEHNINIGEYLIISGGTLNYSVPISGRTFYVDDIGNETYNSKKHVINILKNQFSSGTTIGNVILGKRCVNIDDIDGTTSQYYVHKLKTLTDINGYIMDKVGFESPIFEEEKKVLFENYNGDNDVIVERNRMESVLFDFKQNLTLTGLTNNLGLTPTEVYVTTIFRNGNGYFDYPPKVGFKFNFHDSWVDTHFSGSSSNETALTSIDFTGNTNEYGYTGYTFKSGVTLPVGTILTGSFMEYNISELKERVISETFHKMTIPKNIFDYNQDNPIVYSGSSSENKFGLYYQPHYRVKLRQESPYIETSDTNNIYGLPENTKYFEKDGLWKWRDLYDHGYIDEDGDGTDFPFVNNCHAVKVDINFYLRNEKYYINKKDGIIDFYDTTSNPNSNKNIIC